MLNALRRHATGWIAKALFALLIASFAVWGIGDVFLGPSSGDAVAEVDGSEITANEVTNEFDSQFRSLQEQVGGQLDRQAAASLGVMNQALQTVVARRLVDAHARELDLTMSDATLAERIRQEPSFQEAGTFSRERFELFLRGAGMSEADYVAALRNDLVRGSIIEGLTGAASVPNTLASKLVEYRQEQRRGRVLLVRAGEVQVGEPDEAALETYLAENAKAYEAPERRSLTLVVLRPDDVAGDIEITQDELRQAYDARIAQYRKPEQRRIEQLLATDEAAIREAAELVSGGQSFTAVADALKGSGVERSEVGPLARGDLPAALDGPAWALPEGGVSEPLKSPFGWHLLRASSVEPEVTQPFEAVQDGLRRELALERATNELPDLATRFDDELAAGTGVEDAARRLGLEALKLEHIDRTGTTAEGQRLAPDRLTPEILQAAFAAGAEETSLLQQTPDGHYYLFRVDAVEPARPRKLEEVRDEVVAAWRAAEQKRQAKERAEALLKQAPGPSDFDRLAAGEPAAALIPLGPVTRDAQELPEGLDAAVLASLFATEAGRVADKVVEVPAGAALVATEEVLPAKAEEPMVSATETAVLSSLKNEIIGGYEAALRQRFPVSVNQGALAKLMEAQVQ